jgi:hypothetical protein
VGVNVEALHRCEGGEKLAFASSTQEGKKRGSRGREGRRTDEGEAELVALMDKRSKININHREI